MRDWLARAEQIASSVITYAEACAALNSRDRTHGPDQAALEAEVVRLDAQWSDVFVIPVDGRRAGHVTLEHGLRGIDAAQLSAALRLRDGVTEHAPQTQIAFAAFDQRLLEAAEREGFATLGGPLD